MQAFEYLRPSALEEACAALRDHPKSRVLAGGTDLFAAMKRGIANPDCVISLCDLAELRGISCEPDGALRLGAFTRVAEISEDEAVARQWPVLTLAALQVGSPQIRHVGTLGGNLLQQPRCWYFRHPDFHCQRRGGTGCPARSGRNRYHAILGAGACCAAHPSDLAPALLALDATAEIASSSGARGLPLARLWAQPDAGDSEPRDPVDPGPDRGAAGGPDHRDPGMSVESVALGRDEILTAVRVPARLRGCVGTFLKVSERQATDFALVRVAAIRVPPDDACSRVRLVLGGVAPFPWRAREAEDLIGREGLIPDAIEPAADAALADARPLAENDYKVALARALIVKALRQLVAQLPSGAG